MKTELKPPQWLQISVILLFIWNLVGIFAFVYDLILDPITLDEIRQSFRTNFPLWTKIVYGLAFGLGSPGTFRMYRLKKAGRRVFWLFLYSVL